MGNGYLNRGAHYKISTRREAFSERRALNPILTVVSFIFSLQNEIVGQKGSKLVILPQDDTVIRCNRED